MKGLGRGLEGAGKGLGRGSEGAGNGLGRGWGWDQNTLKYVKIC